MDGNGRVDRLLIKNHVGLTPGLFWLAKEIASSAVVVWDNKSHARD